MKNQETIKYQAWYALHGDKPESLGYGSEKSQSTRFKQLKRFIDCTDTTIYDVGGGKGDFFFWLTNQKISLAKYRLIEPVEEFCDLFAKNSVNCKNVLPTINETGQEYIKRLPNDQVVDYYICCGIFNSQLPWDNRDFEIGEIISKLFHHCKKGLIFNMESFLENLGKKSINDPVYWINFVLKNLTKRVIYNSDYHNFDFQITCLKDED